MGGTWESMSDWEYKNSRFGKWKSAEEKMKSALTGLRMNAPFFSVEMLQKPCELSWEVSTARTNGKKKQFGVDWVLTNRTKIVESGMAHEVGHDKFLHHLRRGNRDFVTWNEAGDYVVNWWLLQAGFEIGEGWLLDSRFADMSVTKVYDILWAEKQASKRQSPQDQQQTPGDGQGTPDQQGNQQGDQQPAPKYFGEVVDMPSSKGESFKPTEDEVKQAEAQEVMTATMAVNAAKRAGKLPWNIDRMVTIMKHGKLSWVEAIAGWATTISHDDYSWKRPNPRYVPHNVYLPSLYTEKVDNIVCIVDTSISIDQKQLAEMVKDIHSLMSTFHIETLTVIYVDTDVQRVEEWSVSEDCHPQPKGGGGTDFRPGFEYIESNDLQPTGIIYLTDGQCSRFPRQEPDCPLCWVIFDGYLENFRPPFGTVVYRHQ